VEHVSFYSINAHASILNEERTEYVGSEGGAFEEASWHGGKFTRGIWMRPRHERVRLLPSSLTPSDILLQKGSDH
jgi:hypothetical protein